MSFTLHVTSSTTLGAARSQATWPTVNKFEHVSGEYWIMLSRDAYGGRSGPISECAPVEFRIGPDGQGAATKVTYLQNEASAPDVVEGLIRFDEIE